MPTLQVRDLPDDVYYRLTELAKMDNRSLAQETVVVLRRGLGENEDPRRRRRTILSTLPDIRLREDRPVPSPQELIREDRDR
jgi:plasmid stability protein